MAIPAASSSLHFIPFIAHLQGVIGCLATVPLLYHRQAGAFPTRIVWVTFSAATSMTDTSSLSLLVT